LNNKEKEELIRKLLEEGLTYDKIAKQAQVSPNRIKQVRDQLEKSKLPKEKSDRSKALEMYNQSRTPFQVATELDISPTDAEKYQLEYWGLMGMNEFAEAYKDNKDSIKSVINLKYELDAKGTTVGKVFEDLKKLDSLAYLEGREQTIAKNIAITQVQLDHFIQQKRIIENELNIVQHAGRVAQLANTNLLNDNHQLHEEVERCRRVLDIMMSSGGFNMVRSIARSEIKTIVNRESTLISSAAASVVKALTDNPELQSIFSYPYAWQEIMRVGNNAFPPTRESQLIQESRYFYDLIKKNITRTGVSSTIDTLGRNVELFNP
jgi:hypothetical protein